jgi:acyl-CoA synthetase (AMP-forming)/AMP-acid ligase II
MEHYWNCEHQDDCKHFNDRFLKTEDLGFFNASGELFLAERFKESFVIDGKISSLERSYFSIYTWSFMIY